MAMTTLVLIKKMQWSICSVRVLCPCALSMCSNLAYLVQGHQRDVIHDYIHVCNVCIGCQKSQSFDAHGPHPGYKKSTRHSAMTRMSDYCNSVGSL